MTYTLPELPYAYNGLEPYMDEETVKLHHDKHHQTYVINYNNLVKDTAVSDVDLKELLKNTQQIPETIRQGVINNGGGAYNHSFFWEVMTPNGQDNSEIKELIIRNFGSFEQFKDEFTKAALGRFGSGWVWLVKNPDGSLKIVSSANQDNPLSQGLTPVLALDVWEHAYYLKYQNRRADYIESWFKIVNWNKVLENYKG